MSHNFIESAKLLGIGRTRLFAILRSAGILNEQNHPLQKYIYQGYFEVSHRSYKHPVIGIKHYGKTLVTEKGLDWIADQFGLSPSMDPDEKISA